jgi:fumarate hydratase class II
MTDFRIEKDSLGEVAVPADALYGAQTQRAVENFPVSGIRFSRAFIRALGLIKAVAAEVNAGLGLLDAKVANAIHLSSHEVTEGKWDNHFPLDIFQTGSGTSTNMNANEVIAARAGQMLGAPVHPNNHVNMGQSSNDVIPAAIHVAAYLEVHEVLLPGLRHLLAALKKREAELHDITKTGRTHLMDAMPVTLGQEISGWAHQVEMAIARIEATLPRLAQLAIGGTAVGTGVNAPKEFGRIVAQRLAGRTGLPFVETSNHFAAQAAMDTAVELSGQLKATASGFLKLANDVRWLNSGPLAGLGEISLPSLQPGSSIMPGKVNPVMCEMLMMVSAQVAGNDTAITISNSHGNFELNVMLPVIAHNLLQSITILGNAARLFADKAVAGFTVNRDRIATSLDRNPILVTALNSVIGYDKAAEIAKKAYKEGRPVRDVAAEMTGLSKDELARLLDPKKLTEGGIGEKGKN